ncbi:MAG: hypothetical protein KGJ38_08215 [Burkholderiaceae bacterium]|nr:hypothetical protein [Burkholderiaceae bacterium]
MIDFTTTRNGVDPQTAACARLLTAVLVAAVRDASEPLTPEECQERRNLLRRPTEALRFLFGPGPAFTVYARAVGSSEAPLRRALCENNPVVAQRRAFWEKQQ